MADKQLSGAAKRKLAREQREADEAHRRELAKIQPGPKGGHDFEDLGPAPLNDPLGAMVWWNNALLICTEVVVRDPILTPIQKAKMVADFAAKGGMIRDKSAESKAMQEALRKKADKQQAAGLEPNASRSDPPTISRPAG